MAAAASEEVAAPLGVRSGRRPSGHLRPEERASVFGRRFSPLVNAFQLLFGFCVLLSGAF